MRRQNNKVNDSQRKDFFANKMQKDLFFLVFFASLVPMIITAMLLYYLIFSITAEQVGIPESIAQNVIPAAKKTTIILVVTIPICILAILAFTYKLTHNMVGPFNRILRELDEITKGTRTGHIRLRQEDKLRPLVDKINLLIDKMK